MPYARAFSTLGCPEASPQEAAALAERFGLDGVELRALGGSLDLPEYFARTWKATEGPIGIGAPVLAIDTGWRLADGSGADRARFLDFLPWAERLGARWLRVFDGGRGMGGEGLDRAAAAVAWWREARAANGWKADIMIETHDSMLDAAAVCRFAAKAPGTAVLWDAFNTWVKSGEDPVATWAALRREGIAVPHLHVKDGVRTPRGEYPFTMTLPGNGEFPMGRLKPALESDFDGVLSLEWEAVWHPYLPPVAEALREAAEKAWW